MQTYSVEEVAGLLKCHAQTIRNMIASGELKAGKAGRVYRISEHDLNEYYQRTGGGQLSTDKREGVA